MTEHGGFGGMLSLRLVGGEADAVTAAGQVRVFKRATSLGGPSVIARGGAVRLLDVSEGVVTLEAQGSRWLAAP